MRAMEGIAKLAGAPSPPIIAYECFGFSRVRFAGFVCAKRNFCSGSEENSLEGVAERAKVCDNSKGLSIQLHGTGIENPEELVDTSHLGHVMGLAFLLFLEYEKVDWVVLRFSQFKGLHDLKTSFPEGRATAFGDVAVPALKLSGLVRRSIVSGIGIERLGAVETANVANFSEDDRAESVAHAVHGAKDFVLWNGFSDVLHLKDDCISGVLRSSKQINTLRLDRPNVRIVAAGCNAVHSEFINRESFSSSKAVRGLFNERSISG